MPPSTNSTLSSQPTNNIYKSMYDQYTNMHAEAFCNANFSPPFNKPNSPDFFWQISTKGETFTWNDDSSKFRTTIFGQIMSPVYGTLHSAKGNHYGNDGTVSLHTFFYSQYISLTMWIQLIRDDSTVKNVFVLGVPVLATPNLAMAFKQSNWNL